MHIERQKDLRERERERGGRIQTSEKGERERWES